jgi:hypothetical protein
MPEDFFANFSQTPVASAGRKASHAFQACCDLNARTGKSRLAFATGAAGKN